MSRLMCAEVGIFVVIVLVLVSCRGGPILKQIGKGEENCPGDKGSPAGSGG